MSNRPNVHYHRHRSGPGVGGSLVVGAFHFVLQGLLMALQLLIWLVPKVLEASGWFVRNILIPAIRALAELIVRLATKASDAYRRRPSTRSGSARGWRS